MRPIDADNLISVLDILSDKGDDIRYWEQLKLIVADCPTADVAEVRHGRWRNYEGMLTCSVCGMEFYNDIMEYTGDEVPRYCPNCGAKMDGDTE